MRVVKQWAWPRAWGGRGLRACARVLVGLKDGWVGVVKQWAWPRAWVGCGLRGCSCARARAAFARACGVLLAELERCCRRAWQTDGFTLAS